MKSEIEVIDSNLDTSKESVIEMTSDTTFNIINHTADNAIIDDSIGSDHVGSHVKLYDDEKYMNKLNVYAQKLGMSLDEIKSKRMSKNQLKKLVRNKDWQAERMEKRKVQRQKRKLKRQEMIEQNRYTPIRFVHMRDSPNKIKIVIDLSFDGHMRDRELQKTFKQVQRCYALNRRSPEPCQLYLTSVSGRIREYIDGKDQSIDKWDVNVIEQNWYDYFKSTGELNKVTYLTADSPVFIPEATTVQQTRGDRIYIIGGLVDHNIYKNLTLNLAKERKVSTGKLPIDKYVRMSMTKVLAINHVFELMLNASAGVSWEESFNRVLPARKVYTDSTDEDDEENDCDGTSDTASSELSNSLGSNQKDQIKST